MRSWIGRRSRSSALERASCAGGSFGAPSAVSGFSTPYPLALNTGIGGADAVELAVARAALGAANLSQIRLAFLTDSATGSDVLATVDGSAGAPAIFFGLPVKIPVLSIWGLGALALVLLTLAWIAHRRIGRAGAVMAVMLVTTAAWAMSVRARWRPERLERPGTECDRPDRRC